MHDATGGVTASRYRVVQGIHRETSLHPVAHRVAHDPAGEHVLDRAEIELALVGPVLGDVGQPQLGEGPLVPVRLGPELGVVAVGVQQCVCSVGLGQLGCGDLLVPPAIVGLTGELQDPQGHRDGNVVSGELAHERVPPFPGRFAWDR